MTVRTLLTRLLDTDAVEPVMKAALEMLLALNDRDRERDIIWIAPA